MERIKQYRLMIQFAHNVGSDRWHIGARLDPEAKPMQNHYESEAAARAALGRLLQRFNRDYSYGADGTRREHMSCGGLGADLVIDRKSDSERRIANWSIQVREVTPWQIIEKNERE